MRSVPLSPLLARVREALVAPDRRPAAMLGELLPLLGYVALEPPDVLAEVCALVQREQPLLAGLRHACEAAGAESSAPGTLAAFGARVDRAPRAIARVAREWLQLGASDTMRLVVCAAGDLVHASVAGLAAVGDVEVAVGEGRPSLDGRATARQLQAAGARVALFADAGVSSALSAAAALLTESPTVAAEGWVAPIGTGPLVAWARRLGVPVVVLAGPEALASDSHGLAALAGELRGASTLVWDNPPDGITVRAPIVELVPLDLADVVISDRGPVVPGDVGRVAAALAAERRPPMIPVRRGRGRPRRHSRSAD